MSLHLNDVFHPVDVNEDFNRLYRFLLIEIQLPLHDERPLEGNSWRQGIVEKDSDIYQYDRIFLVEVEHFSIQFSLELE